LNAVLYYDVLLPLYMVVLISVLRMYIHLSLIQNTLCKCS